MAVEEGGRGLRVAFGADVWGYVGDLQQEKGEWIERHERCL